MSAPKTIMINNEKYVRESDVKQTEKIIKIGADESIAVAMVGKFCLVRSRNEGINAGTVIAADDTGVILENARRLWYHRPADNNLSWYEGVAISGLSECSKVSGTVSKKAIVEDYSLTECSKNAEKSIRGKTPNAQN